MIKTKNHLGLKIYDLDLFEEYKIDNEKNITRVPGGWVYAFYGFNDETTITFIPYNEEYIT